MLETTIAGSLPKPDWLAEPEKLWAAWRFEGEELKRAQQRSAAEWLKHQEEAGIDIVTDGEPGRFQGRNPCIWMRFALSGPGPGAN